MKVLIVDDSILIRRCLVKLIDLVPNITELTEATNVPEAIRLLGGNQPDVVILDLHLPGGSGLDIVRKIKASAFKPLIIILSKLVDQQYRQEALDGGADYFFDKSSEYEQLLQILRDHCGSVNGAED